MGETRLRWAREAACATDGTLGIVTSRLALLVAPADPLLSSASGRLEALGWLRNQMAGRGFKVAIAGAGDPTAELERIGAGLSAGDIVLVHVSGRLVTADSVALSGGGTLALSALSDSLAAREPGYVSMILDLVRDEDLEREPGDLVSDAAGSLGATERGYPVLAAVRDLSETADRIAFTRLAMPPVEDDGPLSGEALLAAMHERAAAGPCPGTCAFFGGAPDPTLDGLVAEATQSGDWRRVVELRLDRVETLVAGGPRAQELAAIARILLRELNDPDGAVDVLEHARSVSPKRAAVLEALRHAYEASGRAPPIDPAEYAQAFAAHTRGGHVDAALLDAMLLEEMGAAAPEHLAVLEASRSVGPMQALKPLDADAWHALRAPGFDEALASVFAAVLDAAVAARLEQEQSARRRSPEGGRLDPESTVSAVRTLHWAAKVLDVTCPDLHPGTEDSGEALTHVPGAQPSITLAPRVLSGTTAKQLAFLAGRALTWCRPEYRTMLYYPTIESLRELVETTLDLVGLPGRSTTSAGSGELRRLLARHLEAGDRAAVGEAAARLVARGGDVALETVALEHWIRSAELTAARAGLLLCGELKTAVAGVRGQRSGSGRPPVERVTSDLLTFCASRAHAALRAQFLRMPAQSLPPPSRGT
jgi:hypothetical protein